MKTSGEANFTYPLKLEGNGIKLLVPEISDLLCMKLRFLITEVSQIRVIIPFTSRARLLRLLNYESDCILLTDYKWLSNLGLYETASLLAKNPHLRMLVFMRQQDIPMTRELYRTGVHGLFSNAVLLNEFRMGLERISRGETFYSQDVVFRLLSHKSGAGEAQSRPIKMTQLEQEVVVRILKGNSNADIAAGLSMTTRAVEISRSRLNRKFQMADVSELIHAMSQEPEFVPYEMEIPTENGDNGLIFTVYRR
ncbi:MAG: LuxR C-terminal-related transcriptional regulator [bacterium]